MSNENKNLTRRDFLELAAAGAAGVAVSGLGASPLLAAPRRGGTVTCGMQWMIQSPDPHRFAGGWANFAAALSFEGLVTPTPPTERVRIAMQKGADAVPQVQPMLAHAWEKEKGATRYVFHLEKGVKFHNGKEFGSDDVKWNWERVADPKHAADARSFYMGVLKSIDTPDPYTVVANLSKPSDAFLLGTSWTNAPMIAKDCVPYGVIWGRTPGFKPPTIGPPGTGPFLMTSFQQGKDGVYEAFKDYRVPGLPYLDKVIYRVLSSATARTNALRAGDIDYIVTPEFNWLTRVLQGKEDRIDQIHTLEKEGLLVYPTTNLYTRTIYMNSHPKSDSPLKNEDLRIALDLCIDRRTIAKVLYGKLGKPMWQGFDPAVSPFGYKDIQRREPDINKAKALVKKAGYPNGVDITLICRAPDEGLKMAQMLQQMCRPAGIRIKPEVKRGVAWISAFRAYKYDMVDFMLYKEDPMNVQHRYLDSRPLSKGFSYGLGITDPLMDKLLEDQAVEGDPKKRAAKFKKVVDRSIEKAYWIPYAKNIGSRAWSTKLQNFKAEEYYFAEQGFREAWV